MEFAHAPEVRAEFPALAAGVVHVAGIGPDIVVDEYVAQYGAEAAARLAQASEGQFPEIQAWRRAFTQMGLKPTQYRCAAESLLRRFRKDGELPRIHPVVDLCNAVSTAFAIPVAVLDVDRVADRLLVTHADGDEEYHTLGGEVEHPQPGEVVFVDAERHAHARRWTHRQSGRSTVRDSTRSVLIVAEGLHDGTAGDVAKLIAAVAEALRVAAGAEARSAMLSADSPRFVF